MDQNSVPKPPKQASRLKFWLIIGLLVITAPFGWYYIGNYIFAGSLNGCEYTEEIKTAPQELRNTTIVLEKNMYLAQGQSPELCTISFQKIDNEIIQPETINNITIGKAYFEKQGRKVIEFSAGKKFTLEKIILETKHGLSTIDSGPGPLTFLILKDEQGNFYQLFTLDIEGINYPYTKYFSYIKANGTKIPLAEDIFNNY